MLSVALFVFVAGSVASLSHAHLPAHDPGAQQQQPPQPQQQQQQLDQQEQARIAQAALTVPHFQPQELCSLCKDVAQAFKDQDAGHAHLEDKAVAVCDIMLDHPQDKCDFIHAEFDRIGSGSNTVPEVITEYSSAEMCVSLGFCTCDDMQDGVDMHYDAMCDDDNDDNDDGGGGGGGGTTNGGGGAGGKATGLVEQQSLERDLLLRGLAARRQRHGMKARSGGGGGGSA